MQKEEIQQENQQSFSTSELWRKYRTLYTQHKRCNLDSPTLLRSALIGWITFVQKYYAHEMASEQAADNQQKFNLSDDDIKNQMMDAIANSALDSEQEKLLDDAIQQKLKEVSIKKILSSYDHLRWIMQKYIQNYNQHSLKKINEYENSIKSKKSSQRNKQQMEDLIQQNDQIQQTSKQIQNTQQKNQQNSLNKQSQKIQNVSSINNQKGLQGHDNNLLVKNITQNQSSGGQELITLQYQNPPLQQNKYQKQFVNRNSLKNNKKQQYFDPQPYESMKQLKKNPYLKMMYRQLCQQCLGRGSKPTFDQIAFASQTMNLNKWMVFCKQFDFSPKLSKNELVNTFKEVTNHLSQMNYQQFLQAIYRVQLKLKMNSKEFIKQSLKADTFDAYRNKMNNLKIQYFGPRTNFFVQSKITTNQKKADGLKYIPVKGMSQQHILRELQLRKQNRKNKNINRSVLTPIIGHKTNESTPKQTARRYYHVLHDQTSYKQIFQSKRVTNSTLQSNSFKLNKIVQQAKMEVDQTSPFLLSPQQYRNKSMIQSSLDKISGDKSYNPEIHLISQTMQAYDIDSDAQSDQILREHYKMEKKGDPNMMISRIYEKLKTNHEQQENMKFETEMMEEDDYNVMITQYR